MITREEAIKRLEDVAGEIEKIKIAIEEGWNDTAANAQTQAFLKKCQGWEDTRSIEEIVADIYAARTTSSKGATIFNEEPS